MLSHFQSECVHLFGEVSQNMGCPRSVGTIYGLLFSSTDPLTAEDISFKLQMSKGAVSLGLRALRSSGAIQMTYNQGCRSALFDAELSLVKLMQGLVRQTVEPQMNRGSEHLNKLRSAADQCHLNQDWARSRVETLQTWLSDAQRATTMLLQISQHQANGG